MHEVLVQEQSQWADQDQLCSNEGREIGCGDLMGQKRNFVEEVKATEIAVGEIPIMLMYLQCVLLQQGGLPGSWLLAPIFEGAKCEDVASLHTAQASSVFGRNSVAVGRKRPAPASEK